MRFPSTHDGWKIRKKNKKRHTQPTFSKRSLAATLDERKGEGGKGLKAGDGQKEKKSFGIVGQTV